MSQQPRLVTLLLALWVLALGCRSWHVETGVSPETLVRRDSPERIQVVRTDSSRTELWNPVVAADSIRGLPTELAVRAISIPLSEIRSVSTRRFSLGKTVLLVLAIGGGAFVYDLLMSVNQRTF
jgi:hypothetical protein